MSLLCFAGKHTANRREIRNQGIIFGSCRRCGRELIRTDTGWRRVPRGFRVVWRRAEPRNQTRRHDRILNLPMVIPRGPSEGEAVTARVLVESRSARPPVGLAWLVLLGLDMLALYGAERFRTWRSNVAATHQRRRAPLLLLLR